MEKQSHKEQVKVGERFEFGKNWQSFLDSLNDERIEVAKKSLTAMLNCEDLIGKTFLDIGNGSGIFSLVAHQLGAKVYSFDFDPSSVICAKELKRRYFDKSDTWIIEEGSVLNKEYIESIGKFDIVYSWGVLHHTGRMWEALENASIPVKENGKLFIAIYNDQGWKSKIWTSIKKTYNANSIGKFLMSIICISYFASRSFVADLLKGNNPFSKYSEYQKNRGMSITHDWIDWIGGYPFEVASPEQIFDFYKLRKFKLERLITQQGLGCNEFVFVKE